MEIIKQLEILDRVNYFGLIESKQIMFCTKANRDRYIYIWCKSSDSTYGLSPAGITFDTEKKNTFSNISRYIAVVQECIQLSDNKIEMWQELYDNNLFPYWEPLTGPFEFNDKKLKKIAICNIFEVNLPITDKDFNLQYGYAQRLLYNKRSFNLWSSLAPKNLSSSIYSQHKDKIISILKKHHCM